MADKTELIRQRMAQKREGLRQKLDALEDRTLGVVKDTTDAVVHAVETVEDTVQSAQNAVKKTVKQSAKMLDITRQVDKHPWAVMGGAVAAGFVASWLVSRGTRSAQSDGGRDSNAYYTGAEPYASNREATAAPSTPAATRESKPNWLSGLMQTFAPSLETLKTLAIGTSVAVARDVVLQAVPAQFANQLNDVFRGLTERLGGDPLPEPDIATQPDEANESSPGEATRPRWEQEAERETRPGKQKLPGNGRHKEARR